MLAQIPAKSVQPVRRECDDGNDLYNPTRSSGKTKQMQNSYLQTFQFSSISKFCWIDNLINKINAKTTIFCPVKYRQRSYSKDDFCLLWNWLMWWRLYIKKCEGIFNPSIAIRCWLKFQQRAFNLFEGNLMLYITAGFTSLQPNEIFRKNKADAK